MKKVFFCPNLAYYAKSIGNDEIETYISLSADGGGTHGEFKFKWVDVAGRLVPRLEAFDDGWKALSQMPELIELLAELDPFWCLLWWS